MKIKQLTWETSTSCDYSVTTEDIKQMLYSIRKVLDNKFSVRFFHGYIPPNKTETENLGFFTSMEEGKEACQAHFGKYITENYING